MGLILYWLTENSNLIKQAFKIKDLRTQNSQKHLYSVSLFTLVRVDKSSVSRERERIRENLERDLN
jgi:hypothetical protein